MAEGGSTADRSGRYEVVQTSQQNAAQNTLNVAPGSIVTVRDADWLVTNASPTRDGLLVEVTGLSELVRDTRAAFYEGLDDIVPLDPRAARLRVDISPGHRQSRLWLESTLRRTPLPLGEGDLSVSTQMLTDALGYQRSAVRKALSSEKLRPRILIADAVGLGKTLEIGMILSELVRRGRGERILIVTPRHVLEQMQHELWCRFALPFVRLDSAGIQKIRQKLPATRNPFTFTSAPSSPMDTLKQPRYLAQLRKLHWDAVVIDEAHNVTNTDQEQRARPGARSEHRGAHPGLRHPAQRTQRVVRRNPASAGPDRRPPGRHFDPQALENLIIRRHRHSARSQEVGADWAEREEPEQLARLRFAAENAIAEELSDVWLYPDGKPARTRARTARSSPGSLPRRSSPALPHSRNGHRAPQEARRRFARPRQEAEALNRLSHAHRGRQHSDSAKYTELVSYLKKIGVGKGSPMRAVVFAERVATLKWLQETLPKALGLKPENVGLLHGGLSDVEQQSIVDQFKRGNSPLRVLVTGDVASEGVNLHAECHHLIHFDIPWSLIRIEQRNGRIDRFGQRQKPQITTLLLNPHNTRFSGDIRVLTRLMEREYEAHTVLNDVASLMGQYSVTEEEKAIRDVLLEGQDARGRCRRARRRSRDTSDLWDFLDVEAERHGETTESTGRETARRSLHHGPGLPCTTPSTRRSERSAHAAASTGRSTPATASPSSPRPLTSSTAWAAPAGLPSSGAVTERPQARHDRRRRQASLKERATRVRRQSWPEAHYLGPLHPVLDWASDRALASMSRNEVLVVRGDVSADGPAHGDPDEPPRAGDRDEPSSPVGTSIPALRRRRCRTRRISAITYDRRERQATRGPTSRGLQSLIPQAVDSAPADHAV